MGQMLTVRQGNFQLIDINKIYIEHSKMAYHLGKLTKDGNRIVTAVRVK